MSLGSYGIVRPADVSPSDVDIFYTYSPSRDFGNQSALDRLTEAEPKKGNKVKASNSGNEPIELIIMDIMMPIMDGYEAMRSIRKMKYYQNIPIIALTAKAMPEDLSKCIDAGANEYLTKPLDVDKLMSMLSIWLYKSYEK